MKYYDLFYDNNTVGRVEVAACGMFYLLKCRFIVGYIGKFRLHTVCNGTDAALGLCVPYGDSLGTECRIPASCFDCEGAYFYLVNESHYEFETVCSNQPFVNLKNLINAKFTIENGNVGIRIEHNCS